MTKFLNNADVKGYVAQTAVTSSLLKTDSNGKLVAAIAGTDYNAPNVSAVAGTLIREIRNTTGATLTKGTVVYISGATGNKATVSKAIATGDSTSAQTFGLCQTDIANNSNGYVVCVGDITGLDTSAFTEGVQLYLSSTTAGTYTSTKQYAPAHLVYVGVVTRSHPNQGQIEVKIQNGYELDEIHDVSISSLANNQTIVWESATSLWKNKTIAAALGYTPADDSAVVKLTGDQTVAGVKTFTSVVNAPTLSLNGGVLAGNNIVSMRSNPTGGQFRIEKSDGSLSAYPFYIGVDGTALAYYYNAAGALKVLLHTNDTSYFGNSLSIGYSTYASTSYMLDVNGTARFVGALTGTTASFTNSSGDTIVLSKGTGPSIQFAKTDTTAQTWALAGEGAAFKLYNYTAGTTPFQISTAGAATFLSSVTATQLYAASSTHGYLNLTAVNTGGNEAGIFFAINGNKWEQYTAANDLAMNWYSYSAASIVMKLSQAGQLRLNTYTSATSFSGTAAGYLAFDSSGNVITVAGVASTVTAGFSLTTQGAANNTPSTPSVNAGVYAGTYAFIDLATQDVNGGWIDFSKGDGGDFAGRIRYYANPERFGFHTAGGVEKITFDAGGNIVLLGGSSSSQSSLSSGLTAIRFPNQYSSGYTDAGVKLYIFNSGTTIQGFTAGPAYDLQYHSSGSDSGRHAFYVANVEVIRFNKTTVVSSQNLAVGSQQGFDNPGGWNKNVLIDGTNHGRFRIKASNYTYGNIDVQLWADSSVSPSHGISGSNAVFSFGGSITSLTVGGQTVIHTGNIGSQSVSNASTLAGNSPNQTGGASTIVQRDGNGYIQNSYFYTSGGGAERNGSGISYVAGFNSGDYYIRSYTMQGLASSMSGATMNINGSSTSCTGNAATAYGWANSPDSWYGIGQSTSSSGATAVGGYYPWTLSYHTGLALSAHSAYGGIRFYNQNYPTGPLASSPVMQIINGGVLINGSAAITTGNYSSYALPLSGGTVTGVADFGTDGGTDTGIGIRSANASSGYGRIRFYQSGTNSQTIHAFSSAWQGGTLASSSSGAININGINGVTFGAWNDRDAYIVTGGQTYARGYRGIGNVAGTGEATYHPAGIYSTGNNWLYGSLIMGGNSISGANTITSNGAVYASDYFRSYGNTGWYNQDYSQGIRTNTPNSSYGTVITLGGGTNGWNGYTTQNNYFCAWMHDSSGNNGFYQQNGRGWILFFNYGNNCWGIGTDNTYSGDGFRCIKYGSAEYGWTTWSDRRAKENITPITSALDTVLGMRGVYYNYIKDEAKSQHVGFIAQELMEVLPQSVRYADEIDEYNINYGPIVSVLAEAIKEQNEEIKSLKAQLQTLLN